MALGFVIERFGYLLELTNHESTKIFQREFSFFIGILLILWASFMAFVAIKSHKSILNNFAKDSLPKGYNTTIPMFTSSIIGILGLLLSIYLLRSIL